MLRQIRKWFIISLVCLSGCTPFVQPAAEQATPLHASPFPAPSTTLPRSTETPKAIAAPTKAKPTASPTPEAREISCFELLDNDSNPDLSGMLVLSGIFYNAPSFILDLSSGERTYLEQNENERVSNIKVSPDYKWAAYKKENKIADETWLVVRDAKGENSIEISWEQNWRQIAGWLDENQLLISIDRGETEIDSLLVIDPFKEKREEIQPDYPEMWIIWLDYTLDWGSFYRSGTIYNPELSKVVYPIQDDQNSGVVLWNRISKEEIIRFYGNWGVEPKWRPNGNGVLLNLRPDSVSPYLKNNEFFYLDDYGEVKQITHLNTNKIAARIGYFNWSPNGDFVAFWLLLDNDVQYPDIYPNSRDLISNRLNILNFKTGKVIDTCVPGDLNQNSPIWSPDGQMLAVEDFYKDVNPPEGRVLLVDIQKNVVNQISENSTPIGWLIP